MASSFLPGFVARLGIEKEVAILQSTSAQIHSFIEVLKKYRDIDVKDVTQPLLLDFIDKILIHDAKHFRESSDSKDIDIYFRAVGCLYSFTK